ncbi:hypothetical protein HDZ31DRAFT_44243 [Schizophyllum fasciatum]
MISPIDIESSDDVGQMSALEQYGAYDFAKDDVYLQGLASIIAGGALRDAPDDVRDEILRRTRVFYFNNLGTTVEGDGDEPAESFSGASSALPGATNAPTGRPADTPHTLTFAELQGLIEAGRVDEIPNNREIPDKLNEAPPSQSTAAPRKKPWELVEKT